MTSFRGSSVTGVSNLYVSDMPNIRGLVLKLDASGISGVDDNGLTSWRDVSGNGYNATPVSGYPVYKTNILNGKPIVRFTAANNDGMRAYFPVSSTYTLFSVARMRDLGSAGRIIGSVNGTAANYLAGWWGGYEDSFYAEGWVNNSTTPATTDWIQYTTKGTGSLSFIYRGGTLLYSNNNGVSSPNGALALSGFTAGTSAEMSNCDIAEVILYNRALSDIARQVIEDYLFVKYGTSIGTPTAPELPEEPL